MARNSTNRYRGILSSMLMAAFFASQIFSCCLVNQRLAHFLETAFSNGMQGEPVAHSCCPRPSAGSAREENPVQDQAGQSQHKGCCIQDASQNLPQIPSEQMPAPVIPDQVLGFLTVSLSDLPRFPARPELRTSSSPPVYLTQQRLLI